MRMVIITLTLVFSWNLTANAYCAGSYSSCDYYLCKEEESPCGPRGYWVDWGHRYCEKFLNIETQFSLQAQQWLRVNRQCLQERTEELVQGAVCSEVRQIAIESHVGCYVAAGFCELSLKDRLAILWHLRTAVVSPEVWIEGVRLEQACRQSRSALGL